MAQINITLETELLKALFIGNHEEAMKKLLNKRQNWQKREFLALNSRMSTNCLLISTVKPP